MNCKDVQRMRELWHKVLLLLFFYTMLAPVVTIMWLYYTVADKKGSTS